MPRDKLVQGMLSMNLPYQLIDIVLRWHQQARYIINHDIYRFHLNITTFQLAGRKAVDRACNYAGVSETDLYCGVSTEAAKELFY